MKKILLFSTILGGLSSFAQTTHMISWRMGIPANEANITIGSGDTVMWMWSSAMPHTVTTTEGAMETFDSGIISGNGAFYSHTFTVTGDTPYVCALHPNMVGTITVEALGLEEASVRAIKVFPNPTKGQFTISGPETIGKVTIYNTSGQKMMESENRTNEVRLYIADYPSGIYFVETESGGKVKRFRIFKE